MCIGITIFYIYLGDNAIFISRLCLFAKFFRIEALTVPISVMTIFPCSSEDFRVYKLAADIPEYN